MANIDTRQLREAIGIATAEAKAGAVSSTRPLDRDVVRMAEIFFLLRFMETNHPEENAFAKEAREWQQVIGTILAAAYREGDPTLGVARDPRKARQYAGEPNPEESGKQTERVYNGFRWFNACRLFVVRLLRVLRFAGISFSGAFLSNLSMLSTIGGLSYGLEVIVDLTIVLRETFAWREHRWKRFWAVLTKDHRPHRLANALVWFGVNLACFFLTGGAAAILNVSLFMFDVFNDAWKAFRELRGYWQLADTFEKKLESLNADPVANHKEIARYQYYLKQTKNKMSGVAKINLYQVALTLTILTGMILIFFPPAGGVALMSVLAIKILGASLAMAGSLFGGLGRKIYTSLTTPRDMQEISPLSVAPAPRISPATSPEKVSPIRQTFVNDEPQKPGFVEPALPPAGMTDTFREKKKSSSFIQRRGSFLRPESPMGSEGLGSPAESPRGDEPLSAFPRRSRPSRCDLSILADERRISVAPPPAVQRSYSASPSALFSRRHATDKEDSLGHARDDLTLDTSPAVISPLRNV